MDPCPAGELGTRKPARPAVPRELEHPYPSPHSRHTGAPPHLLGVCREPGHRGKPGPTSNRNWDHGSSAVPRRPHLGTCRPRQSSISSAEPTCDCHRGLPDASGDPSFPEAPVDPYDWDPAAVCPP